MGFNSGFKGLNKFSTMPFAVTSYTMRGRR